MNENKKETVSPSNEQQTGTTPLSSVPGPAHYRDIQKFPASSKEWLVDVIMGATLQALLVSILARLLAVIGPIFFGLQLLFGSFEIAAYFCVLFGFVIGSLIAGYRFPHFASFRCGISFFIAAMMDAFQVGPFDSSMLEGLRQEPLGYIYSFVVLGSIICGFFGMVGGRWNRGFKEWLELEFEELIDSVRFSDVEWEEVEVDDDEEEEEKEKK